MYAEQLTRLDPKLLSPIRHRREGSHGDLIVVLAADLAEAQMALINA